jgi:CBS domain containing-hemolysin-like protein
MMIQGILDVHDVQLREILIPRPDVVGLDENATVRDAHDLFREHEYSRVPVYAGDLDHIAGVLFSKDLLACISKGQLDNPIKNLARPPHFVPEVMTVKAFIKDVQRLRSHLAVVVDEFGGTEGIVTLHDAIERVVGDIQDEGDDETPEYEQIGECVYRVDGGFSLEDLSDLVRIPIEDEEHNTVTGFLMHNMEKIPAVGDRITHLGVTFTVEKVEKMRVSKVRVEIGRENDAEHPKDAEGSQAQ